MGRDRQDELSHLPPWLREVPLPPRPAGVPGRPEAAPPPASDTPDWLSGIAAEPEAPAEQPDTPAWLRDEPQPPSSQRSSGFTSWLSAIPDSTETPQQGLGEKPTLSEELPDWLASTPPPSAAQEDEPETLPDWLRAAPPEPAQEPEQAVPDWLRAPQEQAPPPAETPAASEPTEDDGVPDWLRDIPEDEIRRVMESGDEDELPIEPFTFEGATGQAEAPAADVPPWLSNMASQADEDTGWFSAETPPAEQPLAEEELDAPAWLRDPSATSDDLALTAPAWLGERAAPPPDQTPTVSHSPETPAENLPAWLQEDTPAAAPSAPSDLPAWLQEDAPAAAPSAPSDLPAWLQEDTPAAPSAPSDLPAWLQEDTSAAAPPSAPSDLPAWLQEDTPAAPPSEPAAPGAGPAVDIPAWLREGQPAAPSEEPSPWPQESAPDAPETPAEELPAWLRPEVGSPTPAERLPDWLSADTPAAPPEPAPAASDDLPDWLRPSAPAGEAAPEVPASDTLPPWLRDESGEPLPTAGAPGDSNLPAWLRGAQIEEPAQQQEQPAPSAERPPQAAPSLDWSAPEMAGREERAATSESELLGGADLPAWLRRETEQPRESSPADARSLDWLARLGPYDDEAEAPVEAPLVRLSLPEAPPRSAAQLEALALLRRIAANPYPEAAPAPLPEAPGVLRRFGLDRALYLILLALLLVTLAMPSLTANLQMPLVAPEASALLDQVQLLDGDDIVLLGYEWDAQRISELRPLERAVIDQLIERRVKLVLVSTDPQGTLLQFDLRDQLDREGYQPGGLDYVLLGYRPGGEIALRGLAQDVRGALRSDFQGNDATIGGLATDLTTSQPRLQKLDDFAMVIVLADEPTDVQGWMEQIWPMTSRPMAFLMPAGVQPIAQPYLRMPNVYYVSGTAGALAYDQLRGGENAEAIGRQTGQLRLSSLVFAGLLVISAIGVGVQALATRRRSA